MARQKATYEIVAMAAEKYVAAGERPTLEKVRGEVGGSNSDVGPMFRQWKESRPAAAMRSRTTPDDVISVLYSWADREEAKYGADLRAEIAEQANEIDAVGKEARAALEDAEAKADEIERLRLNEQTLVAKLDAMTAAAEKANKEAVEHREAAEFARKESAKHEIRLEAMPKLEAELATARAELKAVNKEMNEGRNEVVRVTGKLEAALAAVADLQGREAVAVKASGAAKDEAEKLKAALDGLQARAIKAEAELAAMVKAEAKADAEIGRLRGEIAQLKDDAKAAATDARAEAKPAPKTGKQS